MTKKVFSPTRTIEEQTVKSPDRSQTIKAKKADSPLHNKSSQESPRRVVRSPTTKTLKPKVLPGGTKADTRSRLFSPQPSKRTTKMFDDVKDSENGEEVKHRLNSLAKKSTLSRISSLKTTLKPIESAKMPEAQMVTTMEKSGALTARVSQAQARMELKMSPSAFKIETQPTQPDE